MPDSWRLAIGTLTRLPVPVPRRIDRRTAGRAMSLAPIVGVGLGLVAALLSIAIDAIPGGQRSALAAVVVVASLAWLTRGLHLDGLADTADALGSGRPAEQALLIARKPDIGPFGVVTIVLVLGLDVTALAVIGPEAVGAILLAAVVARIALAWACTALLRPARPDGLGAMVAGSVAPWIPLLWTIGAIVAVGVLAPAWLASLGVAGLVAAGVLVTSRRRLGGITGDVLGATIELTTAAVLVTIALLP